MLHCHLSHLWSQVVTRRFKSRVQIRNDKNLASDNQKKPCTAVPAVSVAVFNMLTVLAWYVCTLSLRWIILTSNQVGSSCPCVIQQQVSKIISVILVNVILMHLHPASLLLQREIFFAMSSKYVLPPIIYILVDVVFWGRHLGQELEAGKKTTFISINRSSPNNKKMRIEALMSSVEDSILMFSTMGQLLISG